MQTMATGSSDILYELCCTPCATDDKCVEAIKQCLDCDALFCGKCFEIHNKLWATSGHKIFDKEEMKMKEKSRSVPQDFLPKERCQTHNGERLSTYCADHDVVCCNICVAVEHRNCNEVTYILKAAEGIQTSEKLVRAKTDLASTLKEMKRIKTEYQNHLMVLESDEKTNIKLVRYVAEGLKKRITELETMDIKQIQSKYKGIRENVLEDTLSLDNMISTVEGSLRTLDQCHQNHDSQVLVDVTVSNHHITEANKNITDIGSKPKSSVKYVLTTDIEHYMNHSFSFGTFTGEQQDYKVELQGEYDVTTSKDKNTSNCIGTCLLPNRTVILTDWNNQCVKRLDNSYNVIDQCEMNGKAWGVACTGPNEIAVTLTNQMKVQFASVRESMFLTWSFSTEDRCRGICFHNGELFVSCGGLSFLWVQEGPGYVAVYSLSGAHLRTIQTNPSGELIFSCPKDITTSKDGRRIYVAQNKGGVVSLNRNGDTLACFTDEGLEHASGVCTLDNDQILVCDRISNNVLQFDSTCNKVRYLLNGNDGIKRPRSLCYNSVNRRLIVTFGKHNTLKVFNLK